MHHFSLNWTILLSSSCFIYVDQYKNEQFWQTGTNGAILTVSAGTSLSDLIQKQALVFIKQIFHNMLQHLASCGLFFAILSLSKILSGSIREQH